MAKELGFPSVDSMMEYLSANEYLEWVVFFSEESFLIDRLDASLAELKYLTTKNPKTKPEDFLMKRWGKPKIKRKEVDLGKVINTLPKSGNRKATGVVKRIK